MQLFYKKNNNKKSSKVDEQTQFKNGQYRIGNGSIDHNKYNMDTMNLIADDLAGLNLT